MRRGNGLAFSYDERFSKAIDELSKDHILLKPICVFVKFGGYEESYDVAKQAIQTAKHLLQNAFLRKIKLHFLACQYNWSRAYLEKHKIEILFIQNGLTGRKRCLSLAAKHLGIETIFLELSPIKGTIQIDTQGINYGSSLTRVSEFYHQWAEKTDFPTDTWRKVASKITARVPLPSRKKIGEKFIFCPLQVPRDTQLTVYGDWVKSVEDLIDIMKEVSPHLPKGWHLRIKEHPSAHVKFTKKLRQLHSEQFILDNSSDTIDLIKQSEGVVTVNSSVGLEAFFFEKPVITLGESFYSFGGMTQNASCENELATLLSQWKTGFDGRLREAFMNYLIAEHFPKLEDVESGKFSLKMLRKRDRRHMKFKNMKDSRF